MFVLRRVFSITCVKSPCSARICSKLNYATAAQLGKADADTKKQKQILIKLRKDTGFPLAKCKQALLKTNYNVKQALKSLNQDAADEGWTKMKNLSGRKTTQGLVTTHRVDNHAVLLEINSESDFVAKTPEFQRFVGVVVRATLEHYSPLNSEQHMYNLSIDEVLKLPAGSRKGTIEDELAKLVGKVKENVNISRGVFASIDDNKNEFIGIYTHPDLDTPRKGGRLPLMGKYAALVGMRTLALEPQGAMWLLGKARDLAQHVVGMSPTTIGIRANQPEKTELPKAEEATSVEPKKTELPKAEEAMAVEPEKTDLPNAEEATSVGDDASNDDDYFYQDSFGYFEMQQYSFDSDELLHQSFLLDPNITVQNWLDLHQLEVKYFMRYELGGDSEETNEES